MNSRTGDPIAVAVIGCGTVGQIHHIPNLVQMPEFDLVALCDTSPKRVETLGSRYGIRDRHTDPSALLSEAGGRLEAAIVSTPSHTHADVASDVLSAGLHTFLEKPVATTLTDARELLAAKRSASSVAMVGYMKRYDPAFQALPDAIAELEAVDLVTAYDTDPDHDRIIEELYDVVETDDATRRAGEPPGRLQKGVEALDTTDSDLAATYLWQLDHVCHDVNLLHTLFGGLRDVKYVDVHGERRYLTAVVEFETGVQCTIHSGESDRPWFEESLRIDGPNGQVEIEFPNPYRKHQQSTLVQRTGVENTHETRCRPTTEENFRAELREFGNCIRTDAQPRTTLEGGARDLETIIELFRTYERGSDPPSTE